MVSNKPSQLTVFSDGFDGTTLRIYSFSDEKLCFFSPCNRQIRGDLTRPSRSEAPGLEALWKKRTSDDPLLFYMTCTHVCVFIFLSFCLFVGSSAKERNLRRSIVIHNLHTRVCTHKVRLWWFDTQLSFNRGLIFDWCIGENVGWRELSKILKAKDEIRRFS